MNTCPDHYGGCRGSAGRLFLFAAALLAAAGESYGIDPHRAVSQYVHDRWGPEQGFPRGSVYAITQTRDGYLWIASQAGLVRFDGVNFQLVTDRSRKFQVPGVLGLAPDKDGSLWLRVPDRSLLRYRNGRFEFPFSRGEEVVAINAIGNSQAGGLLAAKKQLGAFTHRDGELQLLAAAAGMPRTPVLSVAQTGDGKVWLGTRGRGLFQLDGGRTRNLSEGLPDPKVNCLLADGSKDLWIGTDRGVAHWNGTALSFEQLPAPLQDAQVLAMVRDRDANLWLGTDFGDLVRVNASGVTSFNPMSAEQSRAVTALFEDREGNLWTGSANGIERLRDSPFTTYSQAEALPTGGGHPVFVDDEDRTWFAPVTGGLWWFSGSGRRGRVVEGGLDNDVVYSIAGKHAEMWLGRQRGGLTRLRSRNGHFEARTYTTADGLAQNSVCSVYQDRHGAVWAGTLSGGVSRLVNETFETYTRAEGLASNTVASMLESSDGTMWFATPNGLSSLQPQNRRTFRRDTGLPSEGVNCLLEDSAHVLWAGTDAGLAFRTAGQFRMAASSPATLTEPVLGLAEDPLGFLWIATASRVLRVHRQKLMTGQVAAGDVAEFGPADGLRSIEGVRRDRSVVSDSLGRIWLSLNHDISVVDPSRLTARSVPGAPRLQGVSADGNSIDTSGEVRIPAGRQRIVFSYTGLNLSIPERVRFRYKLDGLDRNWSEPTAERQAVYTNLGPGTYRFRLLARSPEGEWSPSEAVMDFGVDPAFWQSWWFRALMVLTFGLLITAAYRWRLRQVTAGLNLRFEERLAERTLIAQELHDTLLQGFISASMQVHVAAGRLPVDSQVKTRLSHALELMSQVIDEGRNVVRGLRSTRQTDLEGALSRMREELMSAQTEESVDLRVVARGARMPLHPVLQEEVYRIGREAVINAFRHAGASFIDVELDYAASFLRLVVRDDGCGIPSQTLNAGREGHWGLPGMRERADRIGAKLRIVSTAGGGTEVELVVPGSVAFQNGGGDAPGLHGKSHGQRRLPNEPTG